MPSIKFFSEDTTVKVRDRRKISSWLKSVIEQEGKRLGEINIILCSDAYLLEMNRQYLQHDTFTDIITFDSSDSVEIISGDIFISIDRVGENSKKFGNSLEEELHRVIVHGILHLAGYLDKSPGDKREMRTKEDHFLKLFHVERN